MNSKYTLSVLVACMLLLGAVATAQEPLSLEGVEVAHEATELQDLLRTHPDRDLVDSALVFTNNSLRPVRIGCRAFDGDGHVVGKVWLGVPARGLRFALASDLSDGYDFIGSARCWSTGRGVTGSAFLLKPLAITDLPSRPSLRRRLVVVDSVDAPVSVDAAKVSAIADVAEAELPEPASILVRLVRFPVVATY